jgi:hypothetical protein
MPAISLFFHTESAICAQPNPPKAVQAFCAARLLMLANCLFRIAAVRSTLLKQSTNLLDSRKRISGILREFLPQHGDILGDTAFYLLKAGKRYNIAVMDRSANTSQNKSFAIYCANLFFPFRSPPSLLTLYPPKGC